MQFLLLIYENEQRFSKGFDPGEMGEYQAFGKQFASSIKGGNALQPTGTAKSVRVRNGKTAVTDGPFAETKEQLAGYYILDCGNLDEAISWATKIPTSCKGAEGCVEIRPIADLPYLRAMARANSSCHATPKFAR